MLQNKFIEKRKHKRFQVAPFLVSPAIFMNKKNGKSFSGIIVDLSAGGMCLIIYEKMEIGTEVVIDFNLGNIKVKGVAGKVTRVKENYRTYQVGIEFSDINKTIKKEIEEIAEDFEKCDKLSMDTQKFKCYRSCKYFFFCSKPIKIK